MNEALIGTCGVKWTLLVTQSGTDQCLSHPLSAYSIFFPKYVRLWQTLELARHSTIRLTLDIYGRANDERMARAIERLDERVRPHAPAADNAITMKKVAVGSELKSATPFNTRELRFSKMVEAAGIEPQILK